MIILGLLDISKTDSRALVVLIGLTLLHHWTSKPWKISEEDSIYENTHHPYCRDIDDGTKHRPADSHYQI